MTAARGGALESAIAEIAFAYEHVPFFRRHLDAAGLDVRRLRTVEDVRRVPATVKADYRRHFPAEILASGTSLADPTLQRSQSSGTAGDRLVTVAERVTLAQRMQAALAVHPPLFELLSLLVRPRSARYAAPNCSAVECAVPNTTIEDRILPDRTLVLPVAHDLLATPRSMLDQAVAELASWRPDWLYADPTHLAHLARHHRATGAAAPCVRAVVLTYTAATMVARRQVREFLPGVLDVEIVSMSEFGWLGAECPLGRLHLNTESYYVELLADDGRPAQPGELAELVITSLGDEVCPHIRYRIGDTCRLLDGCACGHRFPAVTWEGRRRDHLRRGGAVLLTPRGLDEIVGPAPWLDVYRACQLDDEHLEFRYLPNERAADVDERGLRARLAAAVPGLEVRFERAGHLSSERSGKFLACTSIGGDDRESA